MTNWEVRLADKLTIEDIGHTVFFEIKPETVIRDVLIGFEMRADMIDVGTWGGPNEQVPGESTVILRLQHAGSIPVDPKHTIEVKEG